MSSNLQYISVQAAPTLPDLFRERCARTPDARAFVQYQDGEWRAYTWRQTRDQVARWQAAMRADGLQAGERVAIMCANRWEWVIFDQAAQGLGLVVVPVYTNDRAENIRWIMEDSGARLLLVENQAQCEQLGQLVETLDQQVTIVCIEGFADAPRRLRTLQQWLAQAPAEPADYICEPGRPDSLATIVYTSGTTGRPKGVMLSHHNIVFNIQAALQFFDVFPDDLLLSFLPLSHAFERTVGYYLPMAAGTPIAYNRSIAQLAEDLVQVRPTIMISVPRIFERVYGRIHAKLAGESPLKRKLFTTAVNLGWDWFEHRQGRAAWRPALLLRPLLDHLVGSKVRAKLGGRMRFTVCGGAPLSPEIARMFIGLGVPVAQGYGLTETAPVIAANPLYNNHPSSVGLPLPGVEVRVGPNKELLTRSPSVMLGYWNNRQASAEMIDSDGWLHTGDLVDRLPGGHVVITGRSKDIIVMSNGEKVPPSDMENAIAMDELVDQVMIIGEGKPYLSALVVPNPEAFAKLAREFHLDPANEETCCDEKVRSIFMQHIQDRTERFPGYAQVHQLAVVKEPWTPDNGLATPTLKLRRNRIYEQYQQLAEKLYAGHE